MNPETKNNPVPLETAARRLFALADQIQRSGAGPVEALCIASRMEPDLYELVRRADGTKDLDEIFERMKAERGAAECQAA